MAQSTHEQIHTPKRTHKMTHISFHNTNQTKTGFIAELAVLQGKFKPFADLYEAIEAGIVTPKIFEPEDVEKHGYIVMLVGHNDEQLVEWGEKIGLLRGFPIGNLMNPGRF